jgi:crotonobetainyl-CoA:carnitine CoA-transferase CaiB-like acyl-CoA transferase
MNNKNTHPLEGICVLDFGHTVMGPSCGMVLADLGAEVIKIEPVGSGDPTRNLAGFGTGYFGYFNRNKKSISIDLKSEAGKQVIDRLLCRADVLIENFAPGTMDRLGLDFESVRSVNERLIYASLKGFMDGPYQDRLALDEVVQMMSGLAYMTGPSGRPLRAGTSVVDITGGLFAAIGILLALREREETGRGTLVKSALFESTVFLMGQHLSYAAQSDRPIPPMPERVSAWAIYETFELADGKPLFVGITTDNHWVRFCEAIQRNDLKNDPLFSTNNKRIEARPELLTILKPMFQSMTLDEAVAICTRARIPFAPVNHPEDLFNDPHLAATNGLLPTRLPNGVTTKLPRLPIWMEHADFGIRNDPPCVGEHTQELLSSLGLSDNEIVQLHEQGVITLASK